MDAVIPDKAYFRIGEVSKILGVEPYVIRYWETEFKTLKPTRTKTAQRLYRRKDIEALLTIRDLLYQQRFTIDGAKKKLSRLQDDQEDGGNEARRETPDFKTLARIKAELQDIKRMMS